MRRSRASSGRSRILSSLVCLAAGALAASCTGAKGSQTAPPPHAQLELVADPTTAQASTVWLGVLFHLDPGWHIYWQNPGDSGTPPKVEWHLPPGYRAGAIEWPVPKRLGSGSVIDYGYEGQVLLMAPITRPATGTKGSSASDSISADVKYVVCSEVCIPGKAHLTLSPADTAQEHTLFREARAHLPKRWPQNPQISATQDDKHIVLRISVRTRQSITFFPLNAGIIENSAPQQLSLEDDGVHLTLVKSDQLAKPISQLRGLLIFPSGLGFEITAPATP